MIYIVVILYFQVCGISPIKASSIILAGRVFDAFTDPLVGFLITK